MLGVGSVRRERGWQCPAAAWVRLHVGVPVVWTGARSCSPAVTHPPLPPLCPLPSRGCSAVHPLPPPLSQKPELKPERVAAQKAIDGVLVPIIKKTPLMDGYLKTLFSLSKADVPHKMKF